MDNKHDEFTSEAVSDKALDKVTGGTYNETDADFDYLFDLGFISRSIYKKHTGIISAMGCDSEEIFKIAGIKYEWSERNGNKYTYQGKQITQEEAHKIMYKHRHPWG